MNGAGLAVLTAKTGPLAPLSTRDAAVAVALVLAGIALALAIAFVRAHNR